MIGELSPFGPDATFDHVGLAVRSIRDIGGDELKTTRDETQKVSVAFLRMHGITLELVEPLGEDSPISSALQKRHLLLHLCFRVRDIERAMERGRELGFHVLGKAVPAPAFGGRRIGWVYSRVYGLVELLEEPSEIGDA